MSARATPFASPIPPPTRRENAAMARSPPASASGRRSPRRSASQRRSGPAPHVALGERQRLALPATRQADDPRARRLGTVCRCVVRAVVGDDDLCVRERLAERRDGRSDHVLLVAGGDEHGERRAHSSVGVGTGGASGRTPSTASGAHPVAPRASPAEQEDERDASRGLVDRLDGRQAATAEDRERAPLRPVHVDADRRDARRREPAVETGEEVLRLALLRSGGARHDDRVEWDG